MGGTKAADVKDTGEPMGNDWRGRWRLRPPQLGPWILSAFAMPDKGAVMESWKDFLADQRQLRSRRKLSIERKHLAQVMKREERWSKSSRTSPTASYA